jgi:hypothetical protein
MWQCELKFTPADPQRPSKEDTRHIKARRALEAAGVEFIDENGGGPGVRLQKLAKENPWKKTIAIDLCS